MNRHSLSRSLFVRLAGTWAFLVMPALVLSQSAGQGSAQGQTQGSTQGSIQGTGRVSQVVVFRTQAGPRPPRRLADMVMAVPSDNPQSDAKAALGRRLFFDPLLSVDRTVSCATCHEPERAFADARPLAVGVLGRVGKRNSPALVNRGFGRLHFWDGRAPTLETQVLQPIVDPNEMAATLEEIVARLGADDGYRAAFQEVFARPVTSDDLGRALASYLRTIRSGDSPYDRFLDGATDALSADAQLGLTVFRGKGRCTICHREPTFTDEGFHNTGVAWRPAPATDAGTATGEFQDDGRFAVTSNARERGMFKTPTLREIARTAPYMHDGSLPTLSAVVDFYNGGGRPNPNLMPLIRPLGLTDAEKRGLIAFLESLSGVVTGK